MDEATYVSETRASYDALAEWYVEFVRHELEGFPLARAHLAMFAEMVTGSGGGPVLDAGCGPGRISGHLARLGLDMHGLDLSAAMIEIARREHPGLDFAMGSLLDLPGLEASLAGALAWYSLIHIPPADQPQVLAGFHRLLRPGGHLLLAFQIGDGVTRRDRAEGIPVRLDFHRLDLDRTADLALAAGFEVVSRTRQEQQPGESTPQGILLCRKPGTR